MLKRYLAKRNNPWELLAMAALVFFPGLVMLAQTKPMIAFPLGSGSGRDHGPMYGVEIISPDVAHIFGVIALVFATMFVGLYIYMRRLLARSTPHIVEHGHDPI